MTTADTRAHSPRCAPREPRHARDEQRSPPTLASASVASLARRTRPIFSAAAAASASCSRPRHACPRAASASPRQRWRARGQLLIAAPSASASISSRERAAQRRARRVAAPARPSPRDSEPSGCARRSRVRRLSVAFSAGPTSRSPSRMRAMAWVASLRTRQNVILRGVGEREPALATSRAPAGSARDRAAGSRAARRP